MPDRMERWRDRRGGNEARREGENFDERFAHEGYYGGNFDDPLRLNRERNRPQGQDLDNSSGPEFALYGAENRYGGVYGQGYDYDFDYPDPRENEQAGYRGRGPFFGKGPRGYQRSPQRIREDIIDRLTENDWVDARDMEVEVENGEVILRGMVETRRMKRLAEDIAESVTGVRDIHNMLRIGANSPSEGQAIPQPNKTRKPGAGRKKKNAQPAEESSLTQGSDEEPTV